MDAVNDYGVWVIVDDCGCQIDGTEADNELDAWRKAAHVLMQEATDADDGSDI